MYTRELKSRICILLFLSSLLFFSCQERIEERFKREAREYTERNCPSSMGDGITVLDSMVFVDNEETGVWGIYYTVFLDDAQKQELKQKKDDLVALNLKFVKNSPIFIRQKEAGVNFVFVYNDAVTKKKIMECKYTEKDYK